MVEVPRQNGGPPVADIIAASGPLYLGHTRTQRRQYPAGIRRSDTGTDFKHLNATEGQGRILRS